MPDEIVTMDFNDTFLDIDHLRASFPQYEIKTNPEDEGNLVRPFQVIFEDVLAKRNNKPIQKIITVKPHVPPSRGPYRANEPKKLVFALLLFFCNSVYNNVSSSFKQKINILSHYRNQIPFTPTQIEAIRAGMQPGLTLVVGPPGTGKTDVAVQIISNLYHNFPNQRTLIVTHSNQALNQLFEKIMALDIDERHLLRLGHGEEALETEKDFSRYGRVNYVLAKRLDLLMEVQRLQVFISHFF